MIINYQQQWLCSPTSYNCYWLWLLLILVNNDYSLSTAVVVLSHLNIAVLMGLSCRPHLASSSTGCAAHISRIASTQWIALLTLRIVVWRTDWSLLSVAVPRQMLSALHRLSHSWPSFCTVSSQKMAGDKGDGEGKEETDWGQSHTCQNRPANRFW